MVPPSLITTSFDSPGLMMSMKIFLSGDCALWGAWPVFLKVTVSPACTVASAGTNMLSWVSTVTVAACAGPAPKYIRRRTTEKSVVRRIEPPFKAANFELTYWC
jgi:hypothetical protein